MKMINTMVRLWLLLITVSFLCSGIASAFGGSTLRGMITDAEGSPVKGAVLSLYSGGSNIKERPDFVSRATGDDGRYMVEIPAGRYWAVARLKKSEGVGPLMPGDRHSGDPVEIDLSVGKEATFDFIVLDLKDAIRLKMKQREGLVRIRGRILDETGAPVRPAYVFANRKERTAGMPDYFSAWVDEQGNYTLYVPKGSYHLGSEMVFPPAQNYSLNRVISADGDRSEVDIIMKREIGGKAGNTL